jgi:hypothetical protein
MKGINHLSFETKLNFLEELLRRYQLLKYIASNGRMMNRKGFERNRSCCKWSIIPLFVWRAWGRQWKPFVSIGNIAAEIQTEHFSSIIQELYRCAKLFSWREVIKLTSLITHDCSLNLRASSRCLISGAKSSALQKTVDVLVRSC